MASFLPRLSANFPLFYANLVPLSFDSVKQEDYIDAMLSIYENNNIKPLIDLYIHSYLKTADKYDITVEAIGFDRVRVQYRQQRREIIQFIIINQLHHKKMDMFIKSKAKTIADAHERDRFIMNIHEDLNHLGPHSTMGLGVTMVEVNRWQAGEKKSR